MQKASHSKETIDRQVLFPRLPPGLTPKAILDIPPRPTDHEVVREEPIPKPALGAGAQE